MHIRKWSELNIFQVPKIINNKTCHSTRYYCIESIHQSLLNSPKNSTKHSIISEFFRTYSRKNCEMECESRIIEDRCGCVQFFMPRLNENTNVCNQKDFKCYDELSIAIKRSLNETLTCACLPGCFEISYKPSVYLSELGNGSYLMRDKELTEGDQFVNRWAV